MAVGEVDIAADGFFEQFQHAMLCVLVRRRRHGVIEVLCEVEDHDSTVCCNVACCYVAA